MIRPSAVFGTDGNLIFITAQSFSHAAHIHGKNLHYILRNGSAAAVPHFFEHGNMMVNPAGRSDIFILYIFGIAQQNSRTQLVIQKTALDKSGRSHHCAGFKADNIAGQNTEGKHVLFGAYHFIQEDFHFRVSSLGIVIFPVYMDGSIAKLEGTCIYVSASRNDAAVFCFRIIRIHAP